jgi:hypothetical protein
LEIHKKDLETFINRCLRKIFKIFWLNTIPNGELWSLAHETSLEQQIKCRKWKWTGHTLEKGPTAIENQVLIWNPHGQQRRRKPRMTWKRTVAEKAGKTWKEFRALVQNSVCWRCFVEALCSRQE